MKKYKQKLIVCLATFFIPILVQAQSAALPVPVHVSPANNVTLTSNNSIQAVWQSLTSSTTAYSYYYEASYSSTTNADGSFTSPFFLSPKLDVPSVSTVGMPNGTYQWHVRSTDLSGTKSLWSDSWKVTIDNTAPTAPGIPSVISAVPPVTAVATSSHTTGITTSAVATHATASDCWIIVSSKVYSVGSYASMHPGGKTAITSLCGQDATYAFNSRGGTGMHSSSAKATLGTYYVGNLMTVPESTPISLATTTGTQIWVFASSTDTVSGVASYEYSVDGGASWVSSNQSTSVTTHFDLGVRRLTVRAIDYAGNRSTSSTGLFTVTTVGITPMTSVTTPLMHTPHKEKDCKYGAWKTYTSFKFRNEKNCINYAKELDKRNVKDAKRNRDEERQERKNTTEQKKLKNISIEKNSKERKQHERENERESEQD